MSKADAAKQALRYLSKNQRDFGLTEVQIQEAVDSQNLDIEKTDFLVHFSLVTQDFLDFVAKRHIESHLKEKIANRNIADQVKYINIYSLSTQKLQVYKTILPQHMMHRLIILLDMIEDTYRQRAWADHHAYQSFSEININNLIARYEIIMVEHLLYYCASEEIEYMENLK